MKMEVPKEKEKEKDKQKKLETKKHIEFKNVDKHDGQKKELSPRGKSSKLGPKYDRELKKFREETLQKIKIFRNARGDWVRLSGDVADGQQTDSKIFYGLEIDKRRAAIMKKLGFKTSMVRPHRKSLRPRRYFTMKKKISALDFDQGHSLFGPGKMGESPVIREFRKKAKKATMKMARKKELEHEKHPSTLKHSTDAIASRLAVKEKDALLESHEYQPSAAAADKGREIADTELPPKTDESGIYAGELEREEGKGVGDLSSKESKEAFDKILKHLKISFGFEENSVTDDDLEQMKTIWKEYRLGPETTEKIQVQSSEESEGTTHMKSKFLEKLKLKKRIWWRKKRNKTDDTTEWPKDAKPCTCQILEGDGVVILKNVCECAVQCKRKTVVIQDRPQVMGTEEEEIPSLTDVKALTISPKPTLSSHIAGKIVDSLEVIRKRVASKTSRAPKTDVQEREEKERTPDSKAETEKLKEVEIKDIYIPDQKFDSTTSVVTKPLDIEHVDRTKAAVEENKPESAEDHVTETPEKEPSAIMDIKKFKSKRLSKVPKTDEVVLSNSGNKKEACLKNKQSSKEFVEIKEGAEQKETKPRKTWSTLSGKQKSSVESKPAKIMDDSQPVEASSQPPKPILGKGKRKKVKIDRGHVSFDVGAGQSPSGSFLKYGEKKIKTVLSVVSIMKKNG